MESNTSASNSNSNSNSSTTTRETRSGTIMQGIEKLNRDPEKWLIRVCPTTGGEFELSVPNTLTVEGLKHIIGKKIKLPMDKINLLYKDRILKTGSLIRHGVMDGCKFTLLPNVEAGLSSQKADHSIMQVLENLSDKQVNEFLAGKSPLTLAMRLGDHMMFLQLQLSSSPFGIRRLPVESSHHHHHHHRNSCQSQQHHQHQRQQYNLLRENRLRQHKMVTTNNSNRSSNIRNECFNKTNSCTASPIKMLNENSHVTSSSQQQQHLPEENMSHYKSTSRNHSLNSPPPMYFKSPPKPTRLLDSVSSISDTDSPPESPSSDDSYMSDCSSPSPPSSPTVTTIPSLSSTNSHVYHHTSKNSHHCNREKSEGLFNSAAAPILNEATKTLQQKIYELRQMSKMAETISEDKSECVGKTTSTATTASCTKEGNKYPGAVINCMHHVGKGVYSGTFSGTLNPALHDGEGKPKKSLSTIVHILNDLLGASPQGRVPQMDRRPVASRRDRHCFSYNKSEDDKERIIRENKMLKNKVEQVQMMLEHKRQKRRAKREARASPYGWSQRSMLPETNKTKNCMEVNMETELNEASPGDETTSFSGELTPEAVLV